MDLSVIRIPDRRPEYGLQVRMTDLQMPYSEAMYNAAVPFLISLIIVFKNASAFLPRRAQRVSAFYCAMKNKMHIRRSALPL